MAWLCTPAHRQFLYPLRKHTPAFAFVVVRRYPKRYIPAFAARGARHIARLGYGWTAGCHLLCTLQQADVIKHRLLVFGHADIPVATHSTTIPNGVILSILHFIRVSFFSIGVYTPAMDIRLSKNRCSLIPNFHITPAPRPLVARRAIPAEVGFGTPAAHG